MTATGSERIHAERMRQMLDEGWTAAHDDEYPPGKLSLAGICYAAQQADLSAAFIETDQDIGTASEGPPWQWPFDESWWKPSDDPIRNLEKAGALIAAEIDRLQRKERAENRCCEDNVPELSFIRPNGETWRCPVCDRQWLWDEDEAEGGAWWPLDHPTEVMR